MSCRSLQSALTGILLAIAVGSPFQLLYTLQLQCLVFKLQALKRLPRVTPSVCNISSSFSPSWEDDSKQTKEAILKSYLVFRVCIDLVTAPFDDMRQMSSQLLHRVISEDGIPIATYNLAKRALRMLYPVPKGLLQLFDLCFAHTFLGLFNFFCITGMSGVSTD